jgi:hypothetical protein
VSGGVIGKGGGFDDKGVSTTRARKIPKTPGTCYPCIHQKVDVPPPKKIGKSGMNTRTWLKKGGEWQTGGYNVVGDQWGEGRKCGEPQ